MPCTPASTFGSFNFEVTSNASKPKVGTLSLAYTLNNDGTITCASVTYNPPNNGTSQSIDVTFSGTAAPYQGAPTTEPIPGNWNVPGEGAYKYATFTFTPPAGSNTGSLTGQASKDPLGADPDTITFEADPSVGMDRPQATYQAGT